MGNQQSVQRIQTESVISFPDAPHHHAFSLTVHNCFFVPHTNLSPFIPHHLHLGLCGVTASAISLGFLRWLVNNSFKHDWPADWIAGSIDHWARKKEFQRPLKPKCDLNDWGAEQPQESEGPHRWGLQMHQSARGWWWISLCVNLLWI